jgi:hypothetical protein
MARRTKITQDFDEAYKDSNAILNIAGVGNISNLSKLAKELGISKAALKEKYMDNPGGFGDYINSVQRSNSLVVGSYFNSGGLQLSEDKQPTRKLGRFGTRFHNEYIPSLMPKEDTNA